MRTGADVAYKDHDSIGTFQQRAPWAGESSNIPWEQSLRNNPEWAAEHFFVGGLTGQPGAFSEQGARNHATAGHLAQDVQVSAYPHRYNERRGQAVEMLAGLGVNVSDVGDPAETYTAGAQFSGRYGAGRQPHYSGPGGVSVRGGGIHIDKFVIENVTLANGSREEAMKLFDTIESIGKEREIMTHIGMH
jgi:hypothetical protein